MPVEPTKSGQIIDQLALLRLVVGYLGQHKLSGWWDCDFLDATGLRFLETVFPRTFRAAACDPLLRPRVLFTTRHLDVSGITTFFGCRQP